MLPTDPMMLFSYVNTQLRDNYPSLSEMCQALDVQPDEVKKRLAEAGFEYNEQQNKFW